ncbi:PCI domain-containing protein 2 isoform X8 [Scyliorhinus torazame]|uniref:PCI domain-containing protein 2 isoform X8 n=1 Tax=Scyliorhinus torazame TaxID=75743 RepID=UPI003B5B4D56
MGAGCGDILGYFALSPSEPLHFALSEMAHITVNQYLQQVCLCCCKSRLCRSIQIPNVRGSISFLENRLYQLCMQWLWTCGYLPIIRAGIDDSKKWGMLFLINQLFKIYFKINKLHLCKPLIRAIDSSSLKDEYSMAQRVTYKYYVGRKAMFDSDFKQAEEYLSFAFQHCHRSSQKNKRMILIYLLPVKMLLGHMPTVQLLRKYDLLQFSDVTKAVGEGNLLLLNEALAKHEAFFIRCGIFLILEKLKIITYRNLFKKVYLLLRTHQLPLDAFLVALNFMQVEDVDIDEVQCILANLIYMGHIKGYISHQHQKLVVSKQNPFPPLSSVC